MKHLLLVSSLFSLCIASAASLEWDISGLGHFDAAYTWNTTDFLASEHDLDFAVTLRTDLRTGSYGLSSEIEAGLNVNQQQYFLDLHKLRFSATPFPSLTFHLGRFSYLPGNETCLSNINYFSPYNLEGLLTGMDNLPAHLLLPNNLVQAACTFRSLYLTFTWAPFPQPFVLLAPDGPLFPKQDFPTEINLGAPINQRLVLRRIYYPETPDLTGDLRNSSLALEGGGRFSFYEFNVIYYHGWENIPLFTVEAEFPNGLYEYFDLALRPAYTLKDCLGLSQSFFRGGFKVLADLSFTFSKQFLTNTISADNFETLTWASPLFEYTFGLEYCFSRVDLKLRGEIKHHWIAYENENIINSLFDSLFLLFGRYGLPGQNFFIHLGCLGTFNRTISVLSVTQFQWLPSPDLELRLSIPLFFSEEAGAAGQSASKMLFFISLRYSAPGNIKRTHPQ